MVENKDQPHDNKISFEHSLEMMKYYQDEFKYRHAHYWNILIKMLVFDLVVTILPIMTESMGFSLGDGANKYAWVFPMLGVAIAFLSRIIIEEEARKIGAVNKAKYEINEKLPKLYQYRNYVADKTDPKVQLARHLVKYIFWGEIVVCSVVTFMLYGGDVFQFFQKLICGSC